MAAALGASAESFVRRFVRTARDPESGAARLSLREDHRGRCALLVGTNTCSVYGARPEHCRAFPYWPNVLADHAAFESARSTCLGIAVEVDPATRERAFAELEAFYAALPPADEPRQCCLDREGEVRTFATGLEADYALAERQGESSRQADRPPRGGRPQRVSGCRLGDRRPLACRIAPSMPGTSGTSDDGAEKRLRDLRVLERETGYPRAYGELPALLRARESGLEEAGS
jgi:Fe-S-cluster containining protein